MKIQLNVKDNSGNILQSAIFGDQQTLDNFLELLKGGVWGLPEHTVEITPEKVIHHPAIPAIRAASAIKAMPAVLDANGNIAVPAVPGKPERFAVAAVAAWDEVIPAVIQVIPSAYTVEIQDITDKIQQNTENAAARSYLAETDWYCIRQMETGIAIPADITAARQAARLKIV